MCCGVISLVGVVQPSTSNWHNPNQMQTQPEFVALSTTYEVYGDGFLPHTLIQDASIVAHDVYSSKGCCSFLKGILREEEETPFSFHFITLIWP